MQAGAKLLGAVANFLALKLVPYGFVFFLVFLEWLLRTWAGITEEFMGPTLAAAGAGVLVPLINAKDKSSSLPPEKQKELEGYILTTKAERALAAFIQFFLFFLIALWAYNFYLVSKHIPGFFDISPFWLGMTGYFVACILSEIREAI